MDFFQGMGVFANRGTDTAEPHGSTVMFFGHRAKKAVIHLVETVLIDFEEFEGGGRHGGIRFAVSAFERVVAREAEKIINDARRAAGPPGDFFRAAEVDIQLQEFGVPLNDTQQLFACVVIEPGLEREAAT